MHVLAREPDPSRKINVLRSHLGDLKKTTAQQVLSNVEVETDRPLSSRHCPGFARACARGTSTRTTWFALQGNNSKALEHGIPMNREGFDRVDEFWELQQLVYQCTSFPTSSHFDLVLLAPLHVAARYGFHEILDSVLMGTAKGNVALRTSGGKEGLYGVDDSVETRENGDGGCTPWLFTTNGAGISAGWMDSVFPRPDKPSR
ncbi:hypothetical protein CC2G_011331 [Coprinopsis cinerea AmutBmut pab1-1]|nr:hypothetical protein CC2G_011331 [Coprinopsis cinerea AmutBmut pab1-1]